MPGPIKWGPEPGSTSLKQREARNSQESKPMSSPNTPRAKAYSQVLNSATTKNLNKEMKQARQGGAGCTDRSHIDSAWNQSLETIIW